MSIRIFTLEEARRTLPLVRQIVSDQMSVCDELRRLQLQAREEGSQSRRRDLTDQMEDLRHRFMELDEELSSLGAMTKGADLGLVDWYGEIDGRIVYYCWKHDEDDIIWYHDLDAGFAGRRPIPAEAASGS